MEDNCFTALGWFLPDVSIHLFSFCQTCNHSTGGNLVVQSEPGLPSTEPWASLAASCRLEAGDLKRLLGRPESQPLHRVKMMIRLLLRAEGA